MVVVGSDQHLVRWKGPQAIGFIKGSFHNQKVLFGNVVTIRQVAFDDEIEGDAAKIISTANEGMSVDTQMAKLAEAV